MTPISSSRGPKMNPPPDPSRPPTQPPKMPQSEQNAMWVAVHPMEASQIDSVFPVLILFLCSVYSLTDSYPNTPSAMGNWSRRDKKTGEAGWPHNWKSQQGSDGSCKVGRYCVSPVSWRAPNTMHCKPLHHSARHIKEHEDMESHMEGGREGERERER